MQAGLLKMLNKIASDPANQMLIDRYIKLVTELKSEAKKAKHVLDLAQVLEESDPQLSMQYAYMVFQFNSLSTDALKIIVRCLKHLGRLAKAEILSNELNKIESLKQNSAGFSERENSRGKGFSVEVSKISVDGVDLLVSPQSSVFGQQVKQSPTYKVDAFDINAQRATIKISDAKWPLVPPSAAKLEDPKQFVPKNAKQAKQAEKPVLTPPTLVTPPPKALPVQNVPELKQAAWSGPDLGVVLELFDFYYRQGLLQEAEDLMLGMKSDASEMPWWKARMAALAKKRAAKTPNPAAPAAGLPGVIVAPSKDVVSAAIQAPEIPVKVQPPVKAGPAVKTVAGGDAPGESIPQALEELLRNGVYRRALHEIRIAVAQNPTLALAEKLYKAYQECCDELGLMAFKWQKADGLVKLQEQMKNRPKTKLHSGTSKAKKRKAG